VSGCTWTAFAAAFEAKTLLGVDIDAALGGIDLMVRVCLTELDAIDRLPGSVLTTRTRGRA
jgi:hypothetical protein